VSSRGRAEAALAGVTLIWGTSFTLIHEALRDVSTLVFVGLRFTLAGLLLAVIYRRHLADPKGWAGGVLAGLCLTAAYVLQTAGLRYTTPSKSAFLTSLCVVLVPLFAALVYQRVPRAGETAGACLAILGMACLTLPEGVNNWTAGLNRGDLMTAGCAAAFALHILLLGHLVRTTGFAVLSTVQVATVAVACWLSMRWLEAPFLHPTGRLWLALAVTAVLCTALAFTVQAWAQQHTSPARAALIFVLEPVAAAVTSWIATGEQLTARGWLGAALILAGVLTVELKPLPRSRHPR